MSAATAEARISFWCVDDDARLVERSRAGDLKAFERLVERHRDVVYRVASRTVGPAEAEDVSQDDGEEIRVPNHVLVESVVRVHDAAA